MVTGSIKEKQEMFTVTIPRFPNPGYWEIKTQLQSLEVDFVMIM